MSNQNLYELAKKDSEQAMNLIWDTCEELIYNKGLNSLDTYLVGLDPEKLSAECCIAVLIGTLPVRSLLNQRSDFIVRSSKVFLEALEPGETLEQLLTGLV